MSPGCVSAQESPLASDHDLCHQLISELEKLV